MEILISGTLKNEKKVGPDNKRAQRICVILCALCVQSVEGF
jgi:hypothetical protein